MSKPVVAACLLAALGAFAGPLRAQETPRTLPDVVESGGKAVGLLATMSPKGDYEEKFACFFAGTSGVFVTAYQAISEAESLEVMLPDGSKTREVSIVAVDPRKDIAILKVAAEATPTLPFADSDRTRAGAGVVILSRPLGTFVSASSGIVSAVRDSKRGMRLHQLSIPVNKTGLGGPALNERGEVVGLVSFYRLFGESLGFIVPINYVRGLLSDRASMTFAEFVKARKPYQPFDPAQIEAKRLAIVDKVRVSSFQLRETRVRWEQVNEVTGKLRAELRKELDAYGATAAEIFLADPFEVAEHRRLVASLYFDFGEIFAVGDGSDATLFPLASSMLGCAAPSAFPIGYPLTGKKGEPKGKISSVKLSYSSSLFLPLFTPTANLVAMRELSGALSRLVSSEEMPDFSMEVYYTDPAEGKEKEAESIWSNDAYTARWGDLKGRRLWDLQEKIREWKQRTRAAAASSSS
jgi:hypothetical protein